MPDIRNRPQLLKIFLAVLVVFVMAMGAFAGSVDQNVKDLNYYELEEPEKVVEIRDVGPTQDTALDPDMSEVDATMDINQENIIPIIPENDNTGITQSEVDEQISASSGENLKPSQGSSLESNNLESSIELNKFSGALRYITTEQESSGGYKPMGSSGGLGASDSGVEIIIQPDPAEGKDSWVKNDGAYDNDNYGANPEIRVGERSGQPGDHRAYIEFVDLSSIPSDVKILSAELQLFNYACTESEPKNIGVYKCIYTAIQGSVQTPWVEGTTKYDANLDGICWDGTVYSPQMPWFTQPNVDTSTDYGNGPNGLIDQVTITSPTRNWVNWDITPVVKEWVDGTSPNYGLRLMHDEEGSPYGGPSGGRDKVFYSSESDLTNPASPNSWSDQPGYSSGDNYRPRLVVTIEEPGRSLKLGSDNPVYPGDAMGYSQKTFAGTYVCNSRYNAKSEYISVSGATQEDRGWVVFDIKNLTKIPGVEIKKAKLLIHNFEISYAEEINFTLLKTIPSHGSASANTIWTESGPTGTQIGTYYNPIWVDSVHKTIEVTLNAAAITALKTKLASKDYTFAVGIYIKSSYSQPCSADFRDIRLSVASNYTGDLQPTTGEGIAFGDDWSGYLEKFTDAHNRDIGYMYSNHATSLVMENRSYVQWEIAKITDLFSAENLSFVKITKLTLIFNHYMGTATNIYVYDIVNTFAKYNLITTTDTSMLNELYADCGNGSIYYGPSKETTNSTVEYEWPLSKVTLWMGQSISILE